MTGLYKHTIPGAFLSLNLPRMTETEPSLNMREDYSEQYLGDWEEGRHWTFKVADCSRQSILARHPFLVPGERAGDYALKKIN